MKRKSRRKFFFFLVLIFAAISPLLIAYSVGYKISFSRGSFEKTGGIFIKSKTPRLSIFINGVFVKETSLLGGGAIITDLKPGTDLLRIEKAGYQPWSKTIRVEKGIVTELRNILLFPQKMTIATSTKEEAALLEKLAAPPKPGQTKILSSGTKVELSPKGELSKRDGEAKTVLVSNVHAFEIVNDTIIFVDKNGFLAWFDLEKEKVEIIGRPGFYLKEELFRFVSSPQGTVAIIDSLGGVFILDKSTSSILTADSGVKSAFFDERAEKLLLAKENSLGVFWLAPNQTQPFQKKGTREEIFKINSPIQSADWFYGDNVHIVLRTDSGIFITELDGRGGRNTFELVSGKTDGLVTLPEIPNSIFFKKGKNWYKIEI